MTYSEPQLDRLESYAAGLPADQVLGGRIVPWHVLGVPRLHALLATGNIISKTAAGHHGVVPGVGRSLHSSHPPPSR